MAGDEERKQRIVSHMNREHTRELDHYLRHYLGVQRRLASSPSLQDISFRGMTIAAHGQKHFVPFQPPLGNWDEVRTRLVEMDGEAREGLGLSDIYVNEFWKPRGLDLVLGGGVLFYIACFSSLPWVVPGTPWWNLLDANFPGGATWFRWVVQTLFLPVVGIHSAEAFFFDRLRMKRHGVERGSKLWWQWETCCFIEGFTAWRRIDALIAQKRTQKQEKQH